ncbi:MAG: hypothetical protein WC806_04200 [Candidatus Gracilibacteria bacterium]|jgi:hypothetical protein
MINFLIFLGAINIFIVLFASLIYNLGMEKGIQLASIIITTLATLALAFFGWQQMRETNRLKDVQNTADWGKFRNTMWEIMEQYPPRGVEDLGNLSNEEKIVWSQKIRKLLDAEIGNPTLIQRKNSLGHWRNAISTAKVTKDILQSSLDKKEDIFIKHATGILQDVMSVWSELVLDSEEISATGGRP